MSRALRFALIGHPVRHSASPSMQRAAFQTLGLPHDYDLIDCPDETALNTALSYLRRGTLAGINVTIPHKRAVLSKVDALDPSASNAGAANVIVRSEQGKLTAYNTDVGALTEELRELGAGTSSAVIIGAGGAAGAAVAACMSLGTRLIGMTTRSWNDSEALYENEVAESFRAKGVLTLLWPHKSPSEGVSHASTALRLQWRDLCASANVILQTTSAGMPGKDPGDLVAAAVPWAKLQPSTVVLDAVYAPYETPFVTAAKGVGLRVADGVGMLARQGALSFTLWTGQPAPLTVMRSAVVRYLRTGR